MVVGVCCLTRNKKGEGEGLWFGADEDSDGGPGRWWCLADDDDPSVTEALPALFAEQTEEEDAPTGSLFSTLSLPPFTLLMLLNSFLRDNNLASPLFVLSTIFLLLLIFKQAKLVSSKNLPPGPPKLPIIGNLHQVGDRPHVSFAKLAQKFGPLISLQFGKQIVVVASSPEAAMGILKTQDRLLSSRIVPTAFQQASLIPHSLICPLQITTGKVGQLVGLLRSKQGQVIDAEDVVFTTLFNTLSSIIFGKDLLDFKDEHGTQDELKESLRTIIKYGGRVKDLGSFFPML
ncbi:hypothetical protein L1987_48922 [Smallanthus sonchifolius]|uniref:Uncharacterized protein n=1 Tax=Smallanthus sonchifolius TaxID=185202 RepID=A0ACB9FU57_9ASTR|nr:hypothetical protein L1987_48922 [Smallanthus sonchifolius]